MLRTAGEMWMNSLATFARELQHIDASLLNHQQKLTVITVRTVDAIKRTCQETMTGRD